MNLMLGHNHCEVKQIWDADSRTGVGVSETCIVVEGTTAVAYLYAAHGWREIW